MNRTTGSIIMRIIAAGYVVYLGIGIFQMIQEEAPENYMFMYGVAILFVLLGTLIIISSLRVIFKRTKKKQVEDLALEGETDFEVKEDSQEARSKEARPKAGKSMREKAMMGSDSSDTVNNSSLSLQNTDVDIASADIIAATEEIIATEESENTIASINRGIGQEIGDDNIVKNTLDHGMTKNIK